MRGCNSALGIFPKQRQEKKNRTKQTNNKTTKYQTNRKIEVLLTPVLGGLGFTVTKV